ncbi:MAG TPA: FAD-dependent oxidoreductase [Piscinibacter sp.]|jgi:3-(3-hydroxy-phenyl)propionate hydroxylase|uniref:FAD-dependent oxidoreductase n=1 Tax=Piscinibacter sp. TaxID=1903157 RepID=UPI001B5D27D3|nr:FAD-dependent oxidoreductase [Piscinibacter sp.]MBK7533106.1 FAD-dependent oxidoreductase [Piscinibacter sp.]MBP6544543.1 FAD-dependent oxidoreductase [Piscinibacter sp.]HPG77258.1 FAD-dependent oxidoreductase [Piscinibacter sp.]HPM67961.1 FAD-dependent oxidoreductase [Piscinibacter sp.]
MLSTYTYPRYAHHRPAEIERPGEVPRHPVIVVGAGPVGLAAAIDLAMQGTRVLLLDDDDTVSVGSRGLCYAKRALEILDRIGCGDPVVDKGVTWNVGRTFYGNDEVFRFNLLPEADHHRPGMVNLQQYYLEEYLVKRASELPNLELRWKNKVVGVTPAGNGARIEVEAAEGRYALDADWLIVADGARSPIRRQLGLDIEGKVFQDRFLIADVVMKADFPAERWFWFDPPFHPGQSVLLHREADNVWRIDFQLGWDADPEAEKQPERVIPRIRAMLGLEREFELEWVSVYTFQCRRMQSFRHGRVLFVGDAAHQVSPFGARGANSGLQDTDNLVWKLKLVMDGKAPEKLLDTYSDERVFAADENLLNSTRSTDFITPKSQVSRDFRNAVLTLAREHAFARALVNSGRLSVPAHLTGSALNTPDTETFEGSMHPGAPLADAPVRHQGRDAWLLAHTGHHFALLLFVASPADIDAGTRETIHSLADAAIPVRTLIVSQLDGDAPAGATLVVDHQGVAAKRLDARPGTAYLLRPDQHVAARWRRLDAAAVRAALARATCNA